MPTIEELTSGQPDIILDSTPMDSQVWATEEPIEDIINPQPLEDIDLQISNEVLSAEAMLMLTNVADKQPKEVITDLTTKVLEGYKIDLDSRSEWEELNKQIIDLIKLLVKKKTYAGDVVANIKYPLITNACMQFHARAYPEIIKGNDVVKGKVIGADPDGTKFDRAQRICEFMSYQILNEMEDWEEGVDQLLFTLPAIGCAFKKTYFDSIEKRHVSKMVFADDLIVNYFTSSIDRAPRITQRIYLYQNEIVSRINSGVFSKFDVAELGQATTDKGQSDDETPHLFLEQHRWYDLDNDGYQEPYVVTVHYETQKLVRIVPRFASDGIIRSDDGNSIIKIKPEQYFTRYLFMPSIDGGFYGMGFGSLLLSTNSAVNTITNQLLDSGTLSNRQSGFLGRGLRLTKGKSITLKAGEWKPVESTGDDIRKNVFPMPVREPSPVLFQLLGMLIDSGKELSGMTEILSGQSPGANVPAESVLALIEQGLQVYSAIHKRVHRAQYKEFTKLRRLNTLYLDQMYYSSVMDDQAAIVQSDFFDKDFDIVPVSDPNSTTMMQRLLKAKAMLDLRGNGLDDQEIIKRYLKAMDIDDIDGLFPTEQSNPAEQLSMQKLQLEIEELSGKIQKMAAETQLILAKVQTESVGQERVIAGITNDGEKLRLQGMTTVNQMQNNERRLGLEGQKLAVQHMNNQSKVPNQMKREYGLETNNQEPA